MSTSTLRVGDEIEVWTERLAFGGDAVARHNGLAIFIPLAAPEERLRVRITERKKNYARAAIDSVLQPSTVRREPPCRYFGQCGGCQLQHLNYEAQLKSKIAFVQDALERIARIDWPHEIRIKSASELGYRSRTQVKIDWKTRRVGFNAARSNAVCDVESCIILAPAMDRALRALRAAVADTGADRLPHFPEIELAAGDDAIAVEPSVGGLPGGSLHQVAGNATYNFDPSTFFQSNSLLLDDLIKESVQEESGDLGIDLYAGVGLFTIPMARRFRRAIGVESDRRAAQFARENISANDLMNIEFHTGDVAEWLRKYLDSNQPSPDFVLLDPPRTGAAEAMPLVAALKPSRITYVSCDPTTLARDLRALVDSGYELSRVIAIDLFPQTYHVETVAALTRR